MKDLTSVRPRRRTGRVAARAALSTVLVLSFAAPSWTRADDVHLKNGQVFTDVIATETEKGVRIREAFGEITLPSSAVERIVRAESKVDQYLNRRSELQRTGASAEDWMALAEWALREEVGHGAREAAMAAAKREPHLEGLAPLMRSLGYSYSEERRVWLSNDDYMRSLGYARSGGEWISPAEIAERQRAAEEAAEARREARVAAREERLAEAVELLTLQQLVEQTKPTPPPVSAGLPIAVFPGYYPRPTYVAPRRPRVVLPPYAAVQPTYEDSPYALDILIRQPGSLFPIRSHRGSLNTIRQYR